MIDEGDIQNVQGWGYSRTGLRTTALDNLIDLLTFIFTDDNTRNVESSAFIDFIPIFIHLLLVLLQLSWTKV